MSIIEDSLPAELAHATDALAVAVEQMGVTMNEAIEAFSMFAQTFAQMYPMVSTKEAIEAHDMLFKLFDEAGNEGDGTNGLSAESGQESKV